MTVLCVLTLASAALAAPPDTSQQTTTPAKGFGSAATEAKTFAGQAGISTTQPTPAYIIGRIIGSLLGLLGSLFVILIIYAGFLYMTAQGNEEQISKAKKMIVNAAIGIALCLSAYAITTFVIDAIAKSSQAGT